MLDSNLSMVLGLTDNGLPIELLPYSPCSHTRLADLLPLCSTCPAAAETVGKIGTGTAIWYLEDIERLANYAYSQSAPPIVPNPGPDPLTGPCPGKILHFHPKIVAHSSSLVSKAMERP